MAAGLGFKTFTTGDVLTAGDTNGYLMQGVLVFADATARSAAITSPQEGQTSYLKDTDAIQVYSGSAWVTKSAAGDIGQILISTASFTTSAAVNVNSCFSATYDHYLVVLNVSATSSFGTGSPLLRLRASTTDNSSSNYAFTGGFVASSTGASMSLQRSNGLMTSFQFDYGAIQGIAANIRFIAPFLTQRTAINSQSASALASNETTFCNINGTMSVTTSYDGFSIIPPAGTITGTLSVYGMAK
jgi:hypothetical protein